MSSAISRVQHSGLQIADVLYRLVNDEVAPGTVSYTHLTLPTICSV